jgi:hypothetical protein
MSLFPTSLCSSPSLPLPNPQTLAAARALRPAQQTVVPLGPVPSTRPGEPRGQDYHVSLLWKVGGGGCGEFGS